jgi:hypothetical protein
MALPHQGLQRTGRRTLPPPLNIEKGVEKTDIGRTDFHAVAVNLEDHLVTNPEVRAHILGDDNLPPPADRANEGQNGAHIHYSY